MVNDNNINAENIQVREAFIDTGLIVLQIAKVKKYKKPLKNFYIG